MRDHQPIAAADGSTCCSCGKEWPCDDAAPTAPSPRGVPAPDLPREVTVGETTYRLRPYTPKRRGGWAGHGWMRPVRNASSASGESEVSAEMKALLDEIVRLRAAAPPVDDAPPDERTIDEVAHAIMAALMLDRPYRDAAVAAIAAYRRGAGSERPTPVDDDEATQS